MTFLVSTPRFKLKVSAAFISSKKSLNKKKSLESFGKYLTIYLVTLKVKEWSDFDYALNPRKKINNTELSLPLYNLLLFDFKNSLKLGKLAINH
jgi:hypothetical protein